MSLRAVVKMRDDKCEVKTLSCFEWKNLFHLLKYSNLLGDFSAYFAYVLLKFHFVIYCNSLHFKIFSNWNSNVFAMELGLNLGLTVVSF